MCNQNIAARVKRYLTAQISLMWCCVLRLGLCQNQPKFFITFLNQIFLTITIQIKWIWLNLEPEDLILLSISASSNPNVFGNLYLPMIYYTQNINVCSQFSKTMTVWFAIAYTTTCLDCRCCCQIDYFSSKIESFTLRHFCLPLSIQYRHSSKSLIYSWRIIAKMAQTPDNTWSATEVKDNQQEIAKLVRTLWFFFLTNQFLRHRNYLWQHSNRFFAHIYLGWQS